MRRHGVEKEHIPIEKYAAILYPPSNSIFPVSGNG
jgi:hypothetical protein